LIVEDSDSLGGCHRPLGQRFGVVLKSEDYPLRAIALEPGIHPVEDLEVFRSKQHLDGVRSDVDVRILGGQRRCDDHRCHEAEGRSREHIHRACHGYLRFGRRCCPSLRYAQKGRETPNLGARAGGCLGFRCTGAS
jgi:hypothetical protein